MTNFEDIASDRDIDLDTLEGIASQRAGRVHLGTILDYPNQGAAALRNSPTPLTLATLIDLVGAEAWGDTDAQLPDMVAALRA